MSSRTRGAILVSLVLTALLLGVHPSFAQPAVQVEQLVARLDRALDLAAEGASDPSPGRMDSLRAALGLPLSVEVHGIPVSLPEDPVLEQLIGETTGDFEEARAHLERLREAASRTLRAEPPDPGLIRGALDEAYEGVLQVDVGIVESIRRILAELLENLIRSLSRVSAPAPLLGWLVVGAIGVAVIWLLASTRLVPERSVRGAIGTAGPTSSADWRALADDALRRGDLREAVRALYRALLATLAGRGMLTDAATVTAGECRTAVRAVRPTLYAAVADATGRFERVAYGEASPSTADIESLRRAETMARAG